MTLVILQPSYMPWLGYFDQLYKSDVFVFYDDVQFDKHGWRNRNKIKTPQGRQWLTVPVLTKNMNKPLVKDIKIDNNQNWSKKHLNALSINYSKAPYFERYYSELEKILSKEWNYLLDLNVELIRFFTKCLGFERRLEFSSGLGIKDDNPTDRLVLVCKHFGADKFYEGALGSAYMEEDKFSGSGIKLEYQDFQFREYPQLYGDFLDRLSIVDLLFNVGEKSLKFII